MPICSPLVQMRFLYHGARVREPFPHAFAVSKPVHSLREPGASAMSIIKGGEQKS